MAIRVSIVLNQRPKNIKEVYRNMCVGVGGGGGGGEREREIL
jgi:hypothetical protein